MQIFIELSNGKTVPVDINPDIYTLRDLFNYIRFSITDIEFDIFDLIMGDQRITNSNVRIADSGIKKEQKWKITKSLNAGIVPEEVTQPTRNPIQLQKVTPQFTPNQGVPSQLPSPIPNLSTPNVQQQQQQQQIPKAFNIQLQKPQKPNNPPTPSAQPIVNNIKVNTQNQQQPSNINIPQKMPIPMQNSTFNQSAQQNQQYNAVQGFNPQQQPQSTIQTLNQSVSLNQRLQTLQGNQRLGTLNNPNAAFQATERALRQEISSLQQTVSEQEEQIQDKDDTIKKLKARILQLEQELEELRDKMYRQNNEFEDELADKDRKYKKISLSWQEQEYKLRIMREEKEDIQTELDSLKYRSNQLTKYQTQQQNTSEETVNYYELMATVDAQKLNIQRLQQQLIQQRQFMENPEVNIHQIELDQELESLKLQLQQSQYNNSQQTEEITQLRRQIKVKDNDIQQLTQTNEDQVQIFLKMRTENQTYKRDLQRLQEEFAEYKDEFEYYRQVMEERITTFRSNMSASEITLDDADDRLRILEQKRVEREKARQEALIKEEETLRQEADRKKKQRSEAEKNQDAVLQRTKDQRQQMAMRMQQKFLNSHGQMELCFLVDITASMDPYKQQTIQCIEGSMQQIKAETGRDVNWSVVAYQDFQELKQLGKYKQLDFTKDPNAVKNFMRGLDCQGGEDPPEDVRGGILQALKLNWTKEFKIIILITDSPCHGKKYTNGLADDHPHVEDINDAINLLIKNEVVFIGINFTTLTQHMYKQFEKVYQEKNKTDLLIQVDMIKMKEGEIWKEMIALITQGAATATNTNKKETKSKTKQNQVKKLLVKEGAMEALCKSENPGNFETKVDVHEADFDVFRVELKEEALQNKLKEIHTLETTDFNTFKEGSWRCIRTQKPFAFGMMKAVYLMKKKDDPNKHLYVIKAPLDGDRYMSLESAINECRSHLLCKRLMQNFNRELKERQALKNDRTVYPDIMYSDFLILKERNDMYWIAERYFNGEFVKYNNNNGYINSDPTQYNQLAQAFTYYSYMESDFTFMINDVQGVDRFFTDPAVNTTNGNFDETDIGEDGIAMFIVNFQRKKVICERILNLLELKVD